ncbi:DUF1549 domain-containing protein [Gemmata sp.]|uniref:DUF1549 domain-containing protein n=1 Tax=Gemmata sp. TaxID=1914242 RepID=UPI003F6EBC37
MLPVVVLLIAAPPGPPTFEADVRPVLAARCQSCHAGDAPRAGLDVRTRAALLKGGKAGPAVKPGSLKDSPLWLNVSTDKMPAARDKLTDAEKATLRAWILAGAPGEGVAAAAPGAVEGGAAAARGPAAKRGVAATAKAVDDAIDAALARAKVPAAPAADDAEFLRRAYLDLAGVIPTAERAAAFLDARDPDKRTKLVDELLAAPAHGQFEAARWAARLAPEEPAVRPKLQAWLADQFNQGRGWDATVRDLIGATGTGPETGFVLAHVENKKPSPEKLAGATARLFLGIQLQCAECHNHPFSDWTQTDFWALAAFYSRAQVFSKPPAGLRDAEAPLVKPAVKKGAPPVDLSGAVILIGPDAGRGAGKPVRAKFLGGPEPRLDAAGPFRPALAAWVTAADNPFFAEAAVNRVWADLFGRGLANPVDDLSPENPPTHPAVLRALADEFRASGFDRKHLVRCVTATAAYRRTSRGADPPDGPGYARVPVKVMAAGPLFDSLVRATGVKDVPLGTGRGGKGSREAFVRFFGVRDPSAPATEYSLGIPQALGLLNGPAFNRPVPLVEQLVREKVPPDRAVERLFLAALSRRPTPDEAKALAEYAAKRPDPAAGYSGVLWVLLNSPEFVLVP